MTGTSFFYTHTGQWRYEKFGPAELASPLGRGLFAGQDVRGLPGPGLPAWVDAVSTRLSAVTPGFPMKPNEAGVPAFRSTWSASCGRDACGFAAEDPDDPANFPRVLTVWRANLLGLVGQGHGVLHAAPARHRRRGPGARSPRSACARPR